MVRDNFSTTNRDDEGFCRIVEGSDRFYSFIALGCVREGHDYGWGVQITIGVPFTKTRVKKHLTSEQARHLALELVRFAEQAEWSNEDEL